MTYITCSDSAAAVLLTKVGRHGIFELGKYLRGQLQYNVPDRELANVDN